MSQESRLWIRPLRATIFYMPKWSPATHTSTLFLTLPHAHRRTVSVTDAATMKHSGLGGDSGRDPPLTGPDCRECSPTVLARMAGEKRIVSF